MAANAASATDPKNNSLRSFLTSLALNGGLLVAQVGIFVIIKSKLSRVYSPRSYLPPPDRRADELSPGPWRWLPQTLFTPSKSIIHKNGLDAYMSIRFLLMMMKIFAVYTLVTWPILLPINSSGMPITQSDGLGRLGFGNINRTNQGRYWAHLVVAFGLTGFVIWLMRRELLIFIHLRHQFLISKSHAKLSQAKTVLITDLPMEIANEEDLRQLFSFVPGGISRVWIYRNDPALPRLFDERADACAKLERGVTSLLQTAIKARVQQEDKVAKLKQQQLKRKGVRSSFPLRVRATVDDENVAADLEKSGPAKLLENIHRPMHRLGWMPFVGKKVDTINYCTEEIARLNEEIEALRKKLPECKPFGAAFIECELQIGAHVMVQCVSYHEPLFMSQRWTEVSPEDVVWANIDDGAYEVRSRYVLSWAATFGLIILWGFPVALAGFTSNVSQACANHAWLAWICRTPPIVQGIIQGVFPPVLLAVLFLILPYLLYGLAWFENIPRYSLMSLSVYKRYFMFLARFPHITFFSSLSSILDDIQNPTKMVQDFAIYLPNASTFFLTYMLQQGLMGAAGALLQIGPLILYFVKKAFFGSTPREAYQATFFMPSFDFGVMLPRMSLLATIGLAYSIISPIINALALVTFALFYVAWKFLLIWVLDQPDAQETSGLYFPLLMSNLFTGLYFQHVCLMGLFFFAVNEHNDHTSIPEGAIMVLLIVITATAQIFFRNAFKPVIDNLPMSLSTKKLATRFAKERQGLRTHDDHKEDGKESVEGYDLFSRHRVRSVVRHRLRMRDSTGRHSRTPLPEERQKEKENEKEKEKVEAERITAEDEKRKASDKAEIKAQEILEEPSAPRASLDTKGSDKSGKKKSGLLGALAAASPEGIKIDAPAPALVDRNGNAVPDESDTEEYLEDHAFDHPSTYQEQRWIWIPKWDAHPELSETLVNDIKAVKVEAADLGATIDNGGNVEVSRGPPDEMWSGGHDV